MKKEEFFYPYRDTIPGFEYFLDRLHQPFPVHLRINRIKIRPESLLSRLAERGISLSKSIESEDTLFKAAGLKSPGNLIEYYAGYIHPPRPLLRVWHPLSFLRNLIHMCLICVPLPAERRLTSRI